jgi:hypothetical protein
VSDTSPRHARGRTLTESILPGQDDRIRDEQVPTGMLLPWSPRCSRPPSAATRMAPASDGLGGGTEHTRRPCGAAPTSAVPAFGVSPVDGGVPPRHLRDRSDAAGSATMRTSQPRAIYRCDEANDLAVARSPTF